MKAGKKSPLLGTEYEEQINQINEESGDVIGVKSSVRKPCHLMNVLKRVNQDRVLTG
jgi:hypothetical protein